MSAKLSINWTQLINRAIFTMALCFFGSCSFWGSRTVYKSDSKPELGSIAFTKLIQNKVLAAWLPVNDSIHHATLLLTSKEYDITEPVYSELGLVDFDAPNTDDVQQIIHEANCEQLLLTRMTVTPIRYKNEIVTLDVTVEMKLLGRSGETILVTKHNTAIGNSYMSVPTKNQVVHDGIDGAFTKLLKELGQRKKHDFGGQHIWDAPDTRLFLKGTKSELAIYRKADRKHKNPVVLTINDTIEHSFVPNSFFEMQFDWYNSPIKVCTSKNDCHNVKLSPEEVTYVECSFADDQGTPVVRVVSNSEGEFESFKPEKKQRKRDKNK